MNLHDSSFFAGNIQETPAQHPRVFQGLCALLLTGCLLALAGLSQAGPPGTKYGPPPPLPTPDAADEDPPRRDIHMGNVDNMRMGRDAQGNIVMELRPPTKTDADQPNVGPFFIYPQVGTMPGPGPLPYRGGNGGQGRMGSYGSMGQPGQSGRMGQPGAMDQGYGSTGQGRAPMGQPGQDGQTGWTGNQGGRNALGQQGRSTSSWPGSTGQPPQTQGWSAPNGATGNQDASGN